MSDKELNISTEDAKRLKGILGDPVKWAQIFVISFDASNKKTGPWIARWYQAKALRDNSRKKVFRWGRRLGKCLPGWVKIFNPVTGELKTIEDLYGDQRAEVVTMTESFKLEQTETDIVLDNGSKEVFRVKLASGREIDATGNHPLYTKNGWTPIEKINVYSDCVIVPGKLDFFGEQEVDSAEIETLARSVKDTGIPDIVFGLKRELILLFLRSVFDLYGEFNYNSGIDSIAGVKVNLPDKSSLMSMQHLLLRFGISSKVYYKEVLNVFRLSILDRDALQAFKKEIDIPGKESIINKVVSNSVDRSDLADTEASYDIGPDLLWDPVVSIESIGEYQTYDLTIPETHNFIANDIVVHNTETMCIDILYHMYTQDNCRCLIAAPYENQIRLIFSRLKELVEASPLLKEHQVKFTMSPFDFTIDNKSCAVGFTTGAGTGSAAASVRGQKADKIYMDEMDYMNNADFDALTSIAAERDDITQVLSSTPTGRRSKFWEVCTNKKLGYTEYHYPSTVNPNWNEKMADEFKEQLSPEGYTHEIEAEFGEEEIGVFNKTKVDLAMQRAYYAYTPLDSIQRDRCTTIGRMPELLLYDKEHPAPFSMFRTIGCDFDKYGAGSSILVLDYIPEENAFQVIRRHEIPKSEYSYDHTWQTIVDFNEVYSPSWIYCDRGSGEYLLERLHIYGEEHPETNLKNKVRGWRFNNNIDIMNPVSGVMTKEPMKPFMVNQLCITLERDRLIMSPFDSVLHKQLIDYTVVRIAQDGQPIYSSVNEHFVDALGLAHLAFVLEFPELTRTIKERQNSSKVSFSKETPHSKSLRELFANIKNPYSGQNNLNDDSDDLPEDKPPNIIYNPSTTGSGSYYGSNGWGSRNSKYRKNEKFRSSW